VCFCQGVNSPSEAQANDKDGEAQENDEDGEAGGMYRMDYTNIVRTNSLYIISYQHDLIHVEVGFSFLRVA